MLSFFYSQPPIKKKKKSDKRELFRKQAAFQIPVTLKSKALSVMLVSGIQQNESAIYIHTYLLLFRFLSLIDHYRALNRVSCAVHSRSLLGICLIDSVYMSIPT